MRRCPNPERRPPNSAGFTLVEIAVVIVVLSLLLAMIAGIATAMVGQQRREATRQRLAGVETALALFVSQNQRLPCPADGQLAGTDANAGLEQSAVGPPRTCAVAGTANSQRHGVVPWRTLGLAEQDVTDGWGNRLTYRVDADFVTVATMNLTFCDPAGTKNAPEIYSAASGYCDGTCATATFPASCTRPSAIVLNQGLTVQNLAGTAVMSPAASTGSAYVVVSHGENARGAYNNQGLLQAASGPDWGTEEAKNSADLVIAAYYVDDFAAFAEGAGHFDDMVLRPSILTVATKAQLGPRAH